MNRAEMCRARSVPTIAGAASALCMLWACTDGVSRPLGLSPEYADAGPDSELAFDDDLTSGNDSDSEQSSALTCASLERMWPDDVQAQTFVEQLNKLRANPTPICGPSTAVLPALSVEPELECVSRMRLKTEMPQRAGLSPQLSTPDPIEGRDGVDLDERGRKAGIPRDRFMFEMIVTSAPTAQNVLDAFASNFVRVCPTVFSSFIRSVGVARVDHTWVITFAIQRKPANRPGLGGR